VAYVDKIYVYEPTYPDQQLPDRPALILSPPRTPSATSGYIDPENPHSINHLFVDFLGYLEIVLIACDDGDVLGYYTKNIQAAIELRDTNNGPDGILGDELQPFFMHNVRNSAWGLSVHSAARKIAISANTHQVTVVAFGLTNGDIDIEPTEGTAKTNPQNRTSDHKFVIGSFHNNLPSVAFCNTEDDREGRLLISGEITGLVYMDDLETLSRTEIMQVGFCRRIGNHGVRSLSDLDFSSGI
jgi:hypothetical protein